MAVADVLREAWTALPAVRPTWTTGNPALSPSGGVFSWGSAVRREAEDARHQSIAANPQQATRRQRRNRLVVHLAWGFAFLPQCTFDLFDEFPVHELHSVPSPQSVGFVCRFRLILFGTGGRWRRIRWTMRLGKYVNGSKKV